MKLVIHMHQTRLFICIKLSYSNASNKVIRVFQGVTPDQQSKFILGNIIY